MLKAAKGWIDKKESDATATQSALKNVRKKVEGKENSRSCIES